MISLPLHYIGSVAYLVKACLWDMGYVSTDTHCIFRFNSFRFTAAIVQNKRLTDCPQWPRTLFLFLRLLLSDFQCTKTFQVTSGINVSGEVLKVGEHESAVMVDAE